MELLGEGWEQREEAEKVGALTLRAMERHQSFKWRKK